MLVRVNKGATAHHGGLVYGPGFSFDIPEGAPVPAGCSPAKASGKKAAGGKSKQNDEPPAT